MVDLIVTQPVSGSVSCLAEAKQLRKDILCREYSICAVWDWHMDEGVLVPVKQHSQTMSWKQEVPSTSEEPRLPTSLRYLSPPSVQHLTVSHVGRQTIQLWITWCNEKNKDGGICVLTLVHGHLFGNPAQVLGHSASLSSVSSLTLYSRTFQPTNINTRYHLGPDARMRDSRSRREESKQRDRREGRRRRDRGTKGCSVRNEEV